MSNKKFYILIFCLSVSGYLFFPQPAFAQTIGSSVSSFISSVFGSLSSFLGSSPDLPVECGDVVSDMAHRDPKVPRVAAKSLDCSQTAGAGKATSKAKVQRDFSFNLTGIPFSQIIGDIISTRGTKLLNNWTAEAPAADSTSPNHAVDKPIENQSYIAAFNNRALTNPTAMREIIKWQSNPNRNTEDPYLPFRKYGPVTQLSLFDTKQGLQPDDEQRDKMLCAVLSAYKYKYYGKPGSIEMRHDYGAGYVNSETGLPDAVTIDDVAIGKVSRRMNIVEYPCTNPNFECTQYDISHVEKVDLCTHAMGTQFGTGGISADSDIAISQGLTEVQRKLVPSEAAMYGFGSRAFRFVPVFAYSDDKDVKLSKEDVFAKVEEKIIPGEFDLKFQPTEKRESKISLPINDSKAAAINLCHKFSLFDAKNKSDSCTSDANPFTDAKTANSRTVSTNRAAANGGPKLPPDDSSKFKLSELVSFDSLPDFIKNLPASLTQLTKPRDMEVTFHYPKEFVQFRNATALYTQSLMLPELAEAMRTAPNSNELPPEALPLKCGNLEYSGNATADGDATCKFPLIGGPVFAASPCEGVMMEHIRLPGQPTCRDRVANNAQVLRQMTYQALREKRLTQDIKNSLASFNAPSDLADTNTKN